MILPPRHTFGLRTTTPAQGHRPPRLGEGDLGAAVDDAVDLAGLVGVR